MRFVISGLSLLVLLLATSGIVQAERGPTLPPSEGACSQRLESGRSDPHLSTSF